MRRQRARPQLGAGGREQHLVGADRPAADDDHLGVEGVRERGQPDAEAPSHELEHLARDRVAVVRELGDERAGDRAARRRHPAERRVRVRAGRPRRPRARCALPEAITSRQPRFGHLPGQGGPSRSTTTWPSSPADPVAPRWRRPPMTTAPPIPVPSVSISASRAPARGAVRAARRAAPAFVSFSRKTGSPSRSLIRSRNGTSSSGRWLLHMRDRARRGRPATGSRSRPPRRRGRRRAPPRPPRSSSRARPSRSTSRSRADGRARGPVRSRPRRRRAASCRPRRCRSLVVPRWATLYTEAHGRPAQRRPAAVQGLRAGSDAPPRGTPPPPGRIPARAPPGAQPGRPSRAAAAAQAPPQYRTYKSRGRCATGCSRTGMPGRRRGDERRAPRHRPPRSRARTVKRVAARPCSGSSRRGSCCRSSSSS